MQRVKISVSGAGAGHEGKVASAAPPGGSCGSDGAVSPPVACEGADSVIADRERD